MAILGIVGALLIPPAGLPPVVTPWWARALLLGGVWVGRRAPTTALLVLLPGVLLTSCAPHVTLSPALQARVAALADRLAGLPVDPETSQPGAAALLAALRARVSAPPPAASHPPLWAPDVPEEVSNVP